jgi:hypothetical protein
MRIIECVWGVMVLWFLSSLVLDVPSPVKILSPFSRSLGIASLVLGIFLALECVVDFRRNPARWRGTTGWAAVDLTTPIGVILVSVIVGVLLITS